VTDNRYTDFHRPAYRDYRWLETCWFSFFEPRHEIRGHLRAAFRSNMDVAFGMVNIYSRGGGVLDMDFYDSQMHLPMGSSRYADFSLSNGLSVRGHPAPDAYQVVFKSRCKRVTLDLEYTALMSPAGLAFTRVAGTSGGFAAFHKHQHGETSIGHVDQTFRVKGSLRIDDDRFEISCVSNRDHSWSPRGEFRNSCGTFDVLHFGEELSILMQASERELGRPEVTHGYVLRKSELRALKAATVQYERDGILTRNAHYDLLDSAGERWEIAAPVRHSVGQDQGSNGYTVMNYCTPTWAGTLGVGESMWHWDIPAMQRLIRAARSANPSISIEQILSSPRP
jgi:hypothetical protein